MAKNLKKFKILHQKLKIATQKLIGSYILYFEIFEIFTLTNYLITKIEKGASRYQNILINI